MTFSEVARQYLTGFESGEAPQGGMAKFDELRALRLDGSEESLARLDGFLLELHRQGYAEHIDLDDESCQNFLYFVAFYTGRIAGERLKVKQEWVPYKVLVEANPGLEQKLPEVFGTSVLCILGRTLYNPLSTAMARIFEGDAPETRLTTSVEGITAVLRSMN